jgi:hypothetical protein
MALIETTRQMDIGGCGEGEVLEEFGFGDCAAEGQGSQRAEADDPLGRFSVSFWTCIDQQEFLQPRSTLEEPKEIWHVWPALEVLEVQDTQIGDGEVEELRQNAIQVKLGQRKEVSRLQSWAIISGIGDGDAEILERWSGGNESSEGFGQVRHGEVKGQGLQPKGHRIRKDVFLTWVLDVQRERIEL